MRPIRHIRMPIGITRSLLLSIALTACASSSGVDVQPAPDQAALAGVYDWEVPSEGIRGSLTIHLRSGSATRDTLMISDGRVIDCGGIMRRGELGCGDFFFKAAGNRLHGTFRHCHVTIVPTTRTVTDMTGEAREEIVDVERADCVNAMMLLKKRSNQ